jgi:hypothetical protein
MQFKRQQREAAAKTWNASNWFYQNLGTPAREIVSNAYGVNQCTPKQRAQSQEYLTLALSLFARKIGADKSHVVHALLTGSVEALANILTRRELNKGRTVLNAPVNYTIDWEKFAEDWQAAFRDVTLVP